MRCKYLDSGKACDLASQLAGKPVTPHETACSFCTLKCDPPRSINRVTVSIAISSLDADNAKRQELLNTYGHLLPHADPPPNGDERLAAIIRGHGPGSELWKLLELLGVKHEVNCGCLQRAEQMNAWGVAGCRAARADIVAWMKANQDKYKWTAFITAAAKAVTTGVAWRLSVLDPYGSLVDEAIRRADAWAAEHAEKGKGGEA